MIDIVRLFCNIDDFCTRFQQRLEKQSIGKSSTRGRKAALSTSEVITLCILFHQSGFMNIKRFYQEYAKKYLKQEFPGLPSYCRFIQQRNSCFFFLFNYLQTFMASSQGAAMVDPTPLILCHSKRASSCKLFGDRASKGKTMKGWFYGLKLHFAINHQGEIICFLISSGKACDLASLPI